MTSLMTVPTICAREWMTNIITMYVWEPAEKGYKDWNEQLLAKIRLQESVHEEPARREEPEQERQARFHR